MTTKAKARPLERDVQAECAELLWANRCRPWRRNTGMMSLSYKGKSRVFKAGEKGAADLFFACPDERHFELEIKRPGERPSYEQTVYLRATNKHCPSFWVDSVAALERVLPDLLAGGRIEYLDTEWTFSVDEKDSRGRKTGEKIRITEPGADYRVIRTDAPEFSADDGRLLRMRLRPERMA